MIVFILQNECLIQPLKPDIYIHNLDEILTTISWHKSNMKNYFINQEERIAIEKLYNPKKIKFENQKKLEIIRIH